MGGGGVTHMVDVVTVCFCDCVCFIVRRGGIKVSTKTEMMPVEQPFGFEVSLKRTARAICKRRQT